MITFLGPLLLCAAGALFLAAFQTYFIFLQCLYLVQTITLRNSHPLQTQIMRNLSEAILVGMGKLHLYLRYRGRGEAEQELHRKYEGQYRNAGLVLLFDIFMAITVVVVVAVLAGILYLVLN